MSTIFLIISTISFISAFGIHLYATTSDASNWCGYMSSTILSSIPWISGFVLAVIPEAIMIDLFWLWIFLLNAVFVYIFGPILTNVFLIRLASGKGSGVDIITAILIGIISLIIGIVVK